MSRLICVYKGKKMRCTNMFVKEGYVTVIDKEGSCDVNIDELDEYYRIDGAVVYKGYLFDDIDGIYTALKTKEICIFTSDPKLGTQLKFDRHDVRTWVLDIPMTEVEKVIVEKEYLIGEKKGTKEYYEQDIMTFVEEMHEYW